MTSNVPYAEVIGDPVSHSKSPLIHRYWLGKLGLEGDYRATRVEAGALGDHLARRQDDEHWRGCSVTMPHKRSAIPFATRGPRLGGRALPLNLLYPKDGGLHGANTDLMGIEEALGDAVSEPGDVVIVGSGGAAEAALAGLAKSARPITLVARDVAKARHDLGEAAQLARVITFDTPWPTASLLINASPLGMDGFPPFLFALDSLGDHATVFDMVYAPLDTLLLRRAAEQGFRTVDGLRMLVGQARHQFAVFFGILPPAEHDGELRALLTS